MKRASLLVLGTAALALNACIKVEVGGAPTSTSTPAAPSAAPVVSAPAVAAIPAAPACNSKFSAGTAVGGQAITVDLCTVKQGTSQTIPFVYYLGSEKVDSSADCSSGNWTTYPERQVYYPKSAATQTMLNAVCQQAGLTATIAAPAPAPAAPAPVSNIQPMDSEFQVFDPPSNVRTSPNGSILCSVSQKQFIRLSGYTTVGKSTWYRTHVCGSEGWIHGSQVRP